MIHNGIYWCHRYTSYTDGSLPCSLAESDNPGLQCRPTEAALNFPSGLDYAFRWCWRKIYLTLPTYSHTQTPSVWSKGDMAEGARNSALWEGGEKQTGRWVRQGGGCRATQAGWTSSSHQPCPQLIANTWMGRKLIQNSPVVHQHSLLNKVITK